MEAVSYWSRPGANLTRPARRLGGSLSTSASRLQAREMAKKCAFCALTRALRGYFGFGPSMRWAYLKHGPFVGQGVCRFPSDAAITAALSRPAGAAFSGEKNMQGPLPSICDNCKATLMCTLGFWRFRLTFLTVGVEKQPIVFGRVIRAVSAVSTTLLILPKVLLYVLRAAMSAIT
jgi:hypothetical protein